jgi:hypothetical protein
MHGADSFKPSKKRKRATLTPVKPVALNSGAPNPEPQDSEPEIQLSNIEEILKKGNRAANRRKPIATFDYFDADGTQLYQKLKYDGEPKYGQQQPDSNGGWIENLNGVKRVLYRLPELMTRGSSTVFVCEGEKDADNVAALGLCATSADSGTWKPDLIEPLRDHDVIIVPDFDSIGVERALEVSHFLQFRGFDQDYLSAWTDRGEGKQGSDRLDKSTWARRHLRGNLFQGAAMDAGCQH